MFCLFVCFFEHNIVRERERITFCPYIVHVPCFDGTMWSIFDKSALVVITNDFHFLLVMICNKLRK